MEHYIKAVWHDNGDDTVTISASGKGIDLLRGPTWAQRVQG